MSDAWDGDDVTPIEPPPRPPLSQPPHADVTITKMISVDIRHAWRSEPIDFTPWLLDNASELSDVLGIQVELDQREYSVGPFFLDLIGRVAGSDEVVIVENQFGATDHNHLGQIMTYVGGTDPAVVVWVAEHFRDEHRAALDWLNENTPPNRRFFGVALSAIRLEGAPVHLVAPRLELVSEPNDWGKIAKAAAASGPATGAGGASGVNALYKRFWEQFEPEAKSRGWTNATPPAQNWWSLPAGGGGNTWGVSYAMFGCRSELYLGNADAAINAHRLALLQARAQEIESAFGEGKLHFDPLPNNIACRIEVRLEDGRKIANEQLWSETIAWMVDTQERLRAAVASVGGVPTSLPGQT